MGPMAYSRPTHSTRTTPRGRARLLAAAGLIALLGGIGAIVITTAGTEDRQAQAPAATTEPTPTSKPTPKPPAPVKIAVTGVGAYDPEGDQSENGGDAGLATDGSRATAWKSERYRSAFTKAGVGLVVDAGRPVKASHVVVTTETPGYTAQVRVGTSPEGPFVTVSKPKVTTPRTTFALRPRGGRYLMLWITSMPAGGEAAVNELTATAAG